MRRYGRWGLEDAGQEAGRVGVSHGFEGHKILRGYSMSTFGLIQNNVVIAAHNYNKARDRFQVRLIDCCTLLARAVTMVKTTKATRTEIRVREYLPCRASLTVYRSDSSFTMAFPGGFLNFPAENRDPNR